MDEQTKLDLFNKKLETLANRRGLNYAFSFTSIVLILENSFVFSNYDDSISKGISASLIGACLLLSAYLLNDTKKSFEESNNIKEEINKVKALKL